MAKISKEEAILEGAMTPLNNSCLAYKDLEKELKEVKKRNKKSEKKTFTEWEGADRSGFAESVKEKRNSALIKHKDKAVGKTPDLEQQLQKCEQMDMNDADVDAAIKRLERQFKSAGISMPQWAEYRTRIRFKTSSL